MKSDPTRIHVDVKDISQTMVPMVKINVSETSGLPHMLRSGVISHVLQNPSLAAKVSVWNSDEVAKGSRVGAVLASHDDQAKKARKNKRCSRC